MRNAFADTLFAAARKNKDIIILSGDLGFSVFDTFRTEFPNQFLNMGIAEQNMIGVAAGLALCGKKVFVYSIIPFVTFRCLEQIRNDLCYQDLPVVIVGVGSGLSYGQLGFSHHALDDIGALNPFPNLTILSPSDPVEVRQLTKECLSYPHPVYLRLGKKKEQTFSQPSTILRIGDLNQIRQGKGPVFLVHGNIIEEVVKACDDLAGFDPAIISVPAVKPLNEEAILTLLSHHKDIVIVEEHYPQGGLGDAVFRLANEHRSGNRFLHIAAENRYFTDVGNSQHLRKALGLDAAAIRVKTEAFLRVRERGEDIGGPP